MRGRDQGAGRHAEATAPDGLRFSVRSHRDGQFVLHRPDGSDVRALLVWLPVRALEQARRWRRGGWEVAVVLEPIRLAALQYTFARVVHREHIDAEADIAAKVQELASLISRGHLPSQPTAAGEPRR